MANIPGAYGTIPSVWGPSRVEIIETDGKYKIGWSPMDYWKMIFIEGTAEEIARDLITKLQYDSKDYDIPYYGFVYVSFNPEVVCTVKSTDILASSFVVNLKFIQELTEALKPLKKLLPFI